MASISPTSIQCSPEPHSGKKAYLKLTITSISDSDASTNQRYVGWKITVEGTPWVSLKARYASLGGHEIRPLTTAVVNNWSAGQQLDSGNETYSNDSSGNLTLYAYLKQLFYYSYSDTRWNNGTAQAVDANMVCSQLPRYANFTQHYINAIGINTFGVHWETDANCDAFQYSLNGGAWTNGANWPNYTIGGLSPGTGYNIRTRIKRADSQLWTESGYLYVTTASLPDTGTPNNFNLGSSPIPSIGSMSNLSYWYVHTYDGNTLLNDSGAIYSTSKAIDLTNATLINQMLARHPNENEWNITFKYYCVSNGVTYTLTQRTCKCIIPQGQYTPTFNENNVSYEVTDQQTLDLTGSNKKVIKGISDILVTVTPASPNGSATMKSYNATSGNSIGSTTNIDTPTISLTNVSANSVTVQAVDSRNRTTNANKEFSTFIDYFAPIITNASINRIEGVGTNLAVNITGNYCNWSGLSTTNIMEQVSIQYKLKSASTYTTISGVNLNIVNNNGAFTITGNITGNHFSTADEYDVLLTFKDKINTLPFYQSIPTGKALLWRDMANKRIGIGKKPTKTLDVAGNVNIDENLSIIGDTTISGKTHFGENGREDYAESGFDYDKQGNMKHKRDTSTDNFSIKDYNDNKALIVYPETGEIEVTKGNLNVSQEIFASQLNAGANRDGFVMCRGISGENNSLTTPLYHGISMGYPGKNSLDFHEFGGVFRFYRNQGSPSKICEINNDGITFPEKANFHGLLSSNVEYFNSINAQYIEMRITDYGVYGISIWASDKKLKDNIKDSKIDALSIVNKIEHKEFIYKDNNEKEVIKIGYLADQLKEIDEQMIFEVGNEKLKQPNEKYIIPLLSKAIQELSKENNDLKNRISKLEERLDKLEK